MEDGAIGVVLRFSRPGELREMFEANGESVTVSLRRKTAKVPDPPFNVLVSTLTCFD